MRKLFNNNFFLFLFTVLLFAIIANGQKQQPGDTKQDPFNVLSIEGGGIRGIIPAVIIDYIEEYAFKYAVKQNYADFVQRSRTPTDRKRIQSKELFHMITGTSSSAILTAYLVRPNDKNATESYFAQDAIQYFLDNGQTFWQSREINYGCVGILIVISAFMGLYAGYYLGVKIFASPEKIKKLNELKKLINALKELKVETEVQGPHFGIQSEEPVFLKTANNFRRNSSKKQLVRVTQIFKRQGEEKLAQEIEEEIGNGGDANDIIERRKTQIMVNLQKSMTDIGFSSRDNNAITHLLVQDTDENLLEVISQLEAMQRT